jgi:hypothetical protein
MVSAMMRATRRCVITTAEIACPRPVNPGNPAESAKERPAYHAAPRAIAYLFRATLAREYVTVITMGSMSASVSGSCRRQRRRQRIPVNPGNPAESAKERLR